MNIFSLFRRKFAKDSDTTRDVETAALPRLSLANQKLPLGFRYLHARAVLQMKRFESAEELLSTEPAVFYSEEHLPSLVLFISHRWETRSHPDPHAHQLGAIQHVLRRISELHSLLKAPGKERVRRLPSLRTYGVLHAAMLLGATDAGESEDNVWMDWARAVDTRPSEELLDHIGIWYDYSCMPPSSQQSDRGAMRENLLELPELVRSSALIILRQKGDDYSERGWCAAELAAARRDRNIMVLRMDLLGTPVKDSDLSATNAAEAKDEEWSFFESATLFRGVLDEWESKKNEHVSLWNLYVGLPDIKLAEDTRSIPLFTTPRNPNAFPQQEQLLVRFMNILRELSERDTRQGSLRPPFDMAASVRDAMSEIGLECSETWDLVFVGLSILRSRHHPNLVPTIEQLYRIAIERWIRGESLKLERFRERREHMSWEAWYIFEGECSDVRPRPQWAG